MQAQGTMASGPGVLAATLSADIEGEAPPALQELARKNRLSVEAATITVLKQRLVQEWAPEYEPADYKPPNQSSDTISERHTLVSKRLLLGEVPTLRKTKILCTMGPACWSEENMSKLLDAGMNVARFNFSHGDHDAQGQVLERLRKVMASKGSLAATLLDTKGPEIRTAMLKDGKPIDLEAGQDIIVEAVGDKYTEFQGHKTETETRIGLSYAKLCTSVKPGNRILLADGSVVIEVVEILSDTELKGKVLNTKTLGERKNCNLPGVQVDLPVLMEKDIHDLQNFCCKHKMDFVAASFVQSAEDIHFIRRVLDEAGGQNVKIIAKIENTAGLENYDEILKVTDGIMVARGDLGMEIPVEKVPLAQKWMVTKANVAGKFVICATQMLESMVTNPYPTRAEMTDVANAVFDGVDAVMLSGETANGAYPDGAVATMARIVKSAEIGINYYQTWEFMHDFTAKPVGAPEALASALVKASTEVVPGLILVFSEAGKMPRLIAKYKPAVPVMVLTTNEALARQCSTLFGVYPHMIKSAPTNARQMQQMVWICMNDAVKSGLCVAGKEVIVMTSTLVKGHDNSASRTEDADLEEFPERQLYITTAPGRLNFEQLGLAQPSRYADRRSVGKTLSMRAVDINLDMLKSPEAVVRKTKIVSTIGGLANSVEKIKALLEAGTDAVRVYFGQGEKAAATCRELIGMAREAAKQVGKAVPIYMSMVAARMRSSYLKTEGGERIKSVDLKEGEEVIVRLVDQDRLAHMGPDGFGGTTGPNGTTLGVSYFVNMPELLPGQKILIDDGCITLEVQGEMDVGTVLCICTANGTLSEYGSVIIPGVLSAQSELHQLQETVGTLVETRPELLELPVHHAEDVNQARDILEDAGCDSMLIVAKIQDATGLRNADEILDTADAVVVARGVLGLEINPEKVMLAQKVLTTKANVLGKPVIIARQHLFSMVSNPRPTRAEMTDVANVVLDGADGIILSAETSHGCFARESVETAAAIMRNIESACNYYAMGSFIEDFTALPMSTLEATCAAFAESLIDSAAKVAVVVSTSGLAANLVSKYRPAVPLVNVTAKPFRAAEGGIRFAMNTMLVDDLGAQEDVDALVKRAVQFARDRGLYFGGEVAVLRGAAEPDADVEPLMQIIDEPK
ncbi:unnamed protein product [Pedinophyceae sp. YPF-701]|nr:unnamed protein product [Pedinophyceae sp. YPF-701]